MLLDLLEKYSAGGTYPMHMPGHKRNTTLLGDSLPYGIDITEIPGFDNLQNPQDVLRELSDLAAQLYGSRRAFPLVGGSSVGILSAIGSMTKRNDKILMSRNSHMSVYNAAVLFGLKTAYIVPKTDPQSGVSCSVSADDVRRGFDDNPGIKLVVITSPTYEGVVSDIRAIAEVTHENGAALLVDAAHGAHLGFSDNFTESAVQCGADIVVMSLHKTLPALTQCALLHVCGDIASAESVRRYLSMLQTSSPSYILLASIGRCLYMLSHDNEHLFKNYRDNLNIFDDCIKILKNLLVLCHGSDSLANHPGFFAFDGGKIVINTAKTVLTGFQLMDILRCGYKIELEMACSDYAVAMTSVCDTREGFIKLADALQKIDETASSAQSRKIAASPPLPVQTMTLETALSVQTGRFVPLKGAIRKTVLEYVWAYPPGVPIIAPGEILCSETAEYIRLLSNMGVIFTSTMGKIPAEIYVSD